MKYFIAFYSALLFMHLMEKDIVIDTLHEDYILLISVFPDIYKNL
jgi:hypothetical protein